MVIMKTLYIKPGMLVVPLAMARPIAASPDVTLSTSGSVDADKVDVKGASDVNVWDDEW